MIYIFFVFFRCESSTRKAASYLDDLTFVHFFHKMFQEKKWLIYIYIKKNGCVVWIGQDRVKIKNTLYSCISDCCALILSKASGCCIHMPPTADVETKGEEDSMLFRWRSEMCTLISKLYLFIWLFARWSNIRCGIKKASTEKRNFVKWQMDKEKKNCLNHILVNFQFKFSVTLDFWIGLLNP